MPDDGYNLDGMPVALEYEGEVQDGAQDTDASELGEVKADAPEAEAKDSKAPKEGKGGKGGKEEKGAEVVPWERLQEAYQKQAAAEAELNLLKEQEKDTTKESESSYDFSDAESRLRDHIAQSEGDAAVKLLAEMREAERAEVTRTLRAEFHEEIDKLSRGTSAESEARTAVTKLEQRLPELDPTAPQANKEAIQFAKEHLEDYAKRMDIADAVEKAGDLAAKVYGLKGATGLRDVSAKAPVSQPPSLRGVGASGGLGLTAERVAGMTDSELSKVSGSEIRRLRGDFL